MSEASGWKEWVGREVKRTDWVNANHVAQFSALLDRDDPFPGEGDPVPPLFHWTLFTPLARQSELGVDGHARRGGFLPPVPLPRRMWAGSRVRFLAPLRVGDRAEQVSTIDRIDEKVGRAGTLVFVTVRHTVTGPLGLAVEDEQDIVYREAPPASAALSPPPPVEVAPPGEFRRDLPPDPVQLFRYSALTFNGHRIHYDHPYVTAVEGYPGLIVHGPLLATLLVDLARRQFPGKQIERFRFKAIRPTFDTAPFAVVGARGDEPGAVKLWSTDNRGQVALEADAWLR